MGRHNTWNPGSRILKKRKCSSSVISSHSQVSTLGWSSYDDCYTWPGLQSPRDIWRYENTFSFNTGFIGINYLKSKKKYNKKINCKMIILRKLNNPSHLLRMSGRYLGWIKFGFQVWFGGGSLSLSPLTHLDRIRVNSSSSSYTVVWRCCCMWWTFPNVDIWDEWRWTTTSISEQDQGNLHFSIFTIIIIAL